VRHTVSPPNNSEFDQPIPLISQASVAHKHERRFVASLFSQSPIRYIPVAVDSFLRLVEACLEVRATLSAAKSRTAAFRRPALSR
jgi:hypothetical protein